MPNVDLVASSKTLPRRVDVVIIGDGIVGVSTALFLAERKIVKASDSCRLNLSFLLDSFGIG